MRLKETLRRQQVAGKQIIVGDIALTPLSQALILRLPWGTAIWHRPTAVLVQRDKQVRRLPIVDRTRFLQLWLLGFSGVMAIVRVVAFVRRKEESHG